MSASDLDRFTSADFNITNVEKVVWASATRLVAVLNGVDVPQVWSVADVTAPGAKLEPLAVQPADSVDNVWSKQEQDGVILQVGRDILLLEFASSSSSSSSAVTLRTYTTLPEAALLGSVDLTWLAGGAHIVFFADLNPPLGPDPPLLLPPPSRPLVLQSWTPAQGTATICSVSEYSDGLSIAAGGSRAVWKTFLHYVPEEAERGEFYTASLQAPISSDASAVGGAVSSAVAPQPATCGAGKVDKALLSADGSLLVYCCNHSADKPINTHRDVWVITLSASGEPSSKPRNITGGNKYVHDFGWAPSTVASAISFDALWITIVDGVQPVTQIYQLNESSSSSSSSSSTSSSSSSSSAPSSSASPPSAPTPLAKPTLTSVAWSSKGRAAYAIESATEWPAVWDGERSHAVPQPADFDDLTIDLFKWKSFDGLENAGFVCEKTGSPSNAPLLVHAHGGPAIGMPIFRRIASDSTRYPYRHLLKAGYRIFCPIYRGTLGFGDKYSMANVTKQGVDDLQDIMLGIDALVAEKKWDGKLGMFGGSYGEI